VKRSLKKLFSADWTKYALVVAAAVAVDWLAGTSARMLEYFVRHGLRWNLYDPALLAGSLALLWLIWQLWQHSRRHAGVAVHFAGEARACPNLIFFLSPPYAGNPAQIEKDALLLAVQQARLNLLDPAWCPPFLCGSPWRMPLEAIAHHARLAKLAGRQLGRVYLIASPQTRQYAASFCRLVEEGLGQDGLVTPEPPCVDFDDFHDLSEAVNAIFRKVENQPDDRFLMDITSGSKICSAVAAALTFEQGRRLQYVHGHLGYRVAEYDLRYLAPEFLKPGA
jgi:hypothetical protein